MELSVMERIALLDILADYRGTFLNLRIVRELREELSFSEEEFRAFDLRHADGHVSWDETKATLKAVPIGDHAKTVVAEALRGLDRAGRLSDREFPLFERFVEAGA